MGKYSNHRKNANNKRPHHECESENSKVSDSDTSLLRINKNELEDIIARAIKTEMDKLYNKISELEVLINAKDKKIAELEENLDDAVELINEQEQYSRKNSIRIYGLHVPPNTTAVATTVNFLADKLKIGLKEEDFCAVHTLRSGQAEGRRPVILAKLLRSSDKFRIIKERRKLKGAGITISEDLTRKNVTLLNRVKNSAVVEDAWFSNGSVWCKRGGRRFRVRLFQNIDDAIEHTFGSKPPLTPAREKGGSSRSRQQPQPSTSTPITERLHRLAQGNPGETN